MSNDYYEILQVHPKADQEAIHAAYLRLRGLYDPARLEGAADELVAIARQKRDDIERAYAVLSDPALRATYDASAARLVETPIDEGTEELDFRPLPPAGRTERPRGFDATPTQTAGRAVPASTNGRTLAITVGILLAVILAGTAVFFLSGQTPGTLAGIAPTSVPTPSPLDQFETDIASAKAAAQQSPNDPNVLIDYANLLYNSAEIAREFDPTGQAYKDRVPRWLEATQVYSRALALQPDNANVRADYGVSACFYGAGTGNQSYVEQGLAAVQQAAAKLPSDARVQLSLGHCLINTSPPRTPEALEAWLKVKESSSSDSPLAQQAQQLIDQYSK